MSRRSSSARMGMVLASVFTAVALASAVVLVFAEPSAARVRPVAVARTAAPLPPPELFDQLRADAALGNVDASGELATRLLDRFERGSDRDDLYEAVQWISRDWDQPPFARSDIVNRVVKGHCGRPVIKWHWLCHGGD